jgi:ATP synthase I subunit
VKSTIITKIERLNLILLGVCALIGWSLGLLHASSFLTGGIIMQANFWLWKRIAGFLLFQAQMGSREKSWAILWVLVKGLLFLFLVSALFMRYSIQPGSFLLGVSLLLVTCMIVTLSGVGTGIEHTGPTEQKI